MLTLPARHDDLPQARFLYNHSPHSSAFACTQGTIPSSARSHARAKIGSAQASHLQRGRAGHTYAEGHEAPALLFLPSRRIPSLQTRQPFRPPQYPKRHRPYLHSGRLAHMKYRRMPAASSGLSRPISAASYASLRTAANRRLIVDEAKYRASNCSLYLRTDHIVEYLMHIFGQDESRIDLRPELHMTKQLSSVLPNRDRIGISNGDIRHIRLLKVGKRLHLESGICSNHQNQRVADEVCPSDGARMSLSGSAGSRPPGTLR